MPSFVVDPPEAGGAQSIRTHSAYDGILLFTITKLYKISWQDNDGRYVSLAVNLRPLGETELLHCILTTAPVGEYHENVGAPRVIST